MNCANYFFAKIRYVVMFSNIKRNTTGISRLKNTDNVRASYIKKIKAASQLYTVSSNTETKLADITLSNSFTLLPMLKRITEQGWALPQRLNFCYTHEQKLLLYNNFMDGEKTGKKKSPEEVEISIRKKLQPQYVTNAPIRSLFSTFKMQLKKGSLKGNNLVTKANKMMNK